MSNMARQIASKSRCRLRGHNVAWNILVDKIEEADFSFLKKETGASSGNLSVQINKLKEARYIKVTKSFQKNYPQTSCRITKLGQERFEVYVKVLKEYLKH